MITVTTQNPGFSKERCGVKFVKGVAKVEKLTEKQRNFFNAGGYIISGEPAPVQGEVSGEYENGAPIPTEEEVSGDGEGTALPEAGESQEEKDSAPVGEKPRRKKAE